MIAERDIQIAMRVFHDAKRPSHLLLPIIR
jgi:hypothetical protein